MNKKLQDLTDRIYREGVEKAQTEREALLDEARQEARQIVQDAESRARQLAEQAEANAREIRATNESEMRLASRQAMASLRQRIADLIIADVIEEPVREAFRDPEFLKSVVGRLIDHWIEGEAQSGDIQVMLPESMRADLEQYVEQRGKDRLQKGVTVKAGSAMKDGFAIGPSDGSYRINFTSEDFENYFRSFVRPRLFKLLYGEDD